MVIGVYYLTEVVEGAPGEGRTFASLDEAVMAYDTNPGVRGGDTTDGSLSIHANIKVRMPAGRFPADEFPDRFDAKGKECASRWRDRIISIELDYLKKIPGVVGVAAGAERAAAVAAAMRGGFIKSLLIDESGAQALLAG